MDGLNKFKIITIGFICIFILLVSVMYTTTKNVAQKQEVEQEQQEQLRQQAMANRQARLEKEQSLSNISDKENLINEFYSLKNQVEYMSRDVEDLKATESQMRCRVQGIYNNGTIEETTPTSAIREARTNGEDIVLICNF